MGLLRRALSASDIIFMKSSSRSSSRGRTAARVGRMSPVAATA